MKSLSKKWLMLLLSAMMAAIFIPAISYAADQIEWGSAPDGAVVDPIELDQEINADLADGEFSTWAFTPEVGGAYAFLSTGECDTLGCAILPDGKVKINDDGGPSGNFYVFFTAKAGETCYLQAKGYEGKACTFTVRMEKSVWGNIPAEGVEPIGLGQKSVSTSGEKNVATYKFISPVSGTFVFESVGCQDPAAAGAVFDGDSVAADYVSGNAEDGYTDFRNEFTADKGQTVYLQVIGSGTDVTVSLSQKLCWGSVPADADLTKFDAGKTQTFKMGESDYPTYKIQQTADKEMKLVVTAEDADEPVEFQVLAADGTMAAWGELDPEADDDEEENGILYFRASKNKVYYLQFQGFSNEPVSVTAKLSYNSIQGIGFTPAKGYTYVAETGGSWNTDYENGVVIDRYYEYELPWFKKGDKLAVTDSKGKKVTYTFNGDEEFTASGKTPISEDEVEATDEQEDVHWTPENEANNYFYIVYKGVRCKINVTVNPNPVKKVSYIPVKDWSVIEEYKGYWDTDEECNDEGEEISTEEFFVYEDLDDLIGEGDQLIVEGTNGTTDTYRYQYVESLEDDAFVTADGKKKITLSKLKIRSDQQDNHWTKDKINICRVEYMGRSAEVPVAVVENPVESISFKPVDELVVAVDDYEWETIEIDDDEGEEEFKCYSMPDFKEGDVLTVNYKNGTTKDYVLYYNKEEDEYFWKETNSDQVKPEELEFYDVGYTSDQYEQGKHWTDKLGTFENNYVCATYLGRQSEELQVILKKNIEKAKITLSDTAYTFDGKSKKPKIKSVKIGKTTLKNGVDYKLCDNNYGSKYAGYHDVGIVGIGAYTGESWTEFQIRPRAAAIGKPTSEKHTVTIKWTAQKGKTLFFNETKAGGKNVAVTGYQYQCSAKDNFKTSKSGKVKGSKSTSVKVGNLTSKRAYYVRVRTYTTLEGVNYYSAWSKVVKIKTK